VRQRVIVYWRRPHKDRWFVVTNLDWGWRKVSGAFRLRMKIEELFRDEKNLRYGWGLRQLSLSDPQRLERMLLVLAFAYLLVLLVGMRCQQQLPQRLQAASAGRPARSSSDATCRGGLDSAYADCCVCWPAPSLQSPRKTGDDSGTCAGARLLTLTISRAMEGRTPAQSRKAALLMVLSSLRR